MKQPDPDRSSPDEGERTLQLIVRYQNGDGSALDELTKRYLPRVTRIVRVRMGSRLLERTTTDDVVQEVFIRLLRSIQTFAPRSEGSFVAWVSTLVDHEISSQAARIRAPGVGDPRTPIGQDSSVNAPSQIRSPTDGASTKAAKAELALLVDQQVSRLAENHRDVILLRDYAGCDWNAVAEAMREMNPAATVGSCQELYSRACAKLAAAMKRHGAS